MYLVRLFVCQDNSPEQHSSRASVCNNRSFPSECPQCSPARLPLCVRRIVAVADDPQQRHGIERLLLLAQLSRRGALNSAVAPAHSQQLVLVIGGILFAPANSMKQWLRAGAVRSRSASIL